LCVGVGGAVFLRGWAQRTVPLGSYGVIRSKTHGLRERIIREGNFDWIWYLLIPGNTTITVFKPASREFPIEFSGTLPQTETLNAFTGIQNEFSWEVSGACKFSLNPEALPGLIEKNAISNQEELDSYLGRLTADLSAWTQQRLNAYFAEGQAERFLMKLYAEGGFDILSSEIQITYTQVCDVDCRFTVKKMPDFALWETVRVLYTAYLERQRTVLQDAAVTQAERKLTSQFRFDELTRYGELLTKYPVLLEYLEIEQRESKENQ
jgi:hypothetical protein